MSATDPYLDYLARWDQLVGVAVPVGQYGKWKGRMVRKLAPAEFVAKLDEYQQLGSHYQKSLERGDTLNDAVVKLLHERAGELLLDVE
jgi:hypothetical protein